MLVKQDSCRLDNTESFLYTVSCNVGIVECITQMMWVIIIHVIIEATDISMISKACLSRQIHLSPIFHFVIVSILANGCYTYKCLTASAKKFKDKGFQSQVRELCA